MAFDAYLWNTKYRPANAPPAYKSTAAVSTSQLRIPSTCPVFERPCPIVITGQPSKH